MGITLVPDQNRARRTLQTVYAALTAGSIGVAIAISRTHLNRCFEG